MRGYAKIIDEKTKEVQVGVGCDDSYYEEIGMTIMDYEQAYNGLYYVEGYAPQKPEPAKEEKQSYVRSIRNYYLSGTDYTQLQDAPFTQEEKEEYQEYRQYLRDYTQEEDWWEKEPKTFDEWKQSNS